eukprot:7411188-Heterocapsa_arctica.AAC.2
MSGNKAMIIIPGTLQRELTNNKEPNKVRITQPFNDDPTQVWTITHVPECSDELKKDSNKEVSVKMVLGSTPSPLPP